MTVKKLGNYIIERELGRGGMGIVYLAHEESLQRAVALKVMSPSLLHDQTSVQRFLREARAGARLQHPNIVPVHAVGQADGHYFISMAYVKGTRLSDVIRQQGQLPVHQALDIARQIADALAEAHQHGIVHRDIKPDNIMIDQADRVQVMDFGLAHLMSSQSNLTADHMKVGTARYMAPEQCRGGKVDGRTDLYALGVVLFEMLAGRAPFKADSPLAVMYQITNEPLPALQELNSSVPREVVSVVQGLTAKDMEKRYPSATVVRDGLLQLQHKLGGSGVSAQSASSQSGMRSGAQRVVSGIKSGGRSVPIKKVAIGVGALAILAVLVIPFLRSNDSTPGQPPNLNDAASVPSQSITPRVVTFPSDRAVGRVLMRAKGHLLEFGRSPSPAQGSVMVREGEELGLFVRPQDSADIGFLQDFGPNELDYLVLEHPRIANDDVRNIEHLTGLNYLLVEYNDFTDAGLSSLRKLTNLQFLGLGGTKVTDDGLASLTFLRRLKGLSVGGTQITDRGIRSLQSLPLETIMLAGYALTPSMVDVLKGFPGLTLLRIDAGRAADADRIAGGDRPIDAATIARVSEITQLRTLMLAGKLHDDSLIPALSRLTFLESIIFDGDTSVTPAGRNELRRALPGCTITPEDVPGGNRAENKSSAQEPRTVTFPSDRVVGTVFMRRKGPDATLWGGEQGPAQGQVTVPEGLEIGLWVRGRDSADLSFLQALAPNDLDYLGLFHPSMTADQLKNIEHLTGLKTLGVGYCGLTDSWLRSFDGLTNLEMLLLGSTDVTDAGLATFTGLERLKLLGLERTRITHRGIRGLTRTSNLERLLLSPSALTPSMVDVLKEIPSLRRLKIVTDTDVNGEFYGPASPDSILLLKDLAQLENLTLEGTLNDDSLIPPLSQLAFLKEIEFRSTSVTPAGRNELRRALPNCTITPEDAQGQNRAENESPKERIQVAWDMVDQGKYREAVEAFELVRAGNPEAVEPIQGIHFATAYAVLGDYAGHENLCRWLFDTFGESRLTDDVARTAKAYLVYPEADNEELFARCVKLTQYTVENATGPVLFWHYVDHGMALYRLKRYAEAGTWLQRSIDDDRARISALALAYLALAEFGQGNEDVGRGYLERARTLAAQVPNRGKSWQDAEAINLALGEAEAFLGRAGARSRSGVSEPGTLTFPADRVVGEVYVRDAGKIWLSGWGGSIGPARGRVMVPKDKEVGVWVNWDHAPDLGFLQDLAADDLSFLMINRPEIDDRQLRNVEHLTGLKSMYAVYCRITDAGLRSFRGLMQLAFLGLEGTAITDEGLGQLAGLERLTGLGLGNTGITHRGIRAIDSLRNMEWISLDGSALSQRMVDALRAYPKLETLVVDAGTPPKNFGADILSHLDPAIPTSPESIARLRDLPKLRTLALRGELNGDALIPALSQLTALKRIEFQNTSVTAEGRNKLRRALPGCTITP